MTDNAQKRIGNKESLQKATTDMLAYPLDIGSQGESKYTIFNIYQYNKSQVNKVELKSPLGSIILPIPPELNNTDSLNYEEFSAPLIQAGFAYGSAEDLGSAFSALGGSAAVVGAAFLSKVPGGENAVNQVAAISGASVNPRNTNIFKNPTERAQKSAQALEDALIKLIDKARRGDI